MNKMLKIPSYPDYPVKICFLFYQLKQKQRQKEKT